MKGSKRIWTALALALIMVGCLALGGCKKKADETTAAPVETQAETTTAAEETTEAAEEATKAVQETRDGMVRSYLTGEWVDEEIGTKRPLAIMISNVKGALPNEGINSAGVIYETPMEGFEVRLEMLTENYENLERIGSIRSARTYHPQIAKEFDAIYVHYGHSKYAVEDLDSGNIDDIDGVYGRYEPAFYRTDDRKAPHNAFSRPALIDAMIDKMGYDRSYSEDYSGKFVFAADDSPVVLDGENASKVTIGYSTNKPWFEYNEEDQLYYRYQYGDAHTDVLDGEQLTCRNIIVQYCDFTIEDDKKNHNIKLIGEGEGVYITGGQAIPITWSKSEKWGKTTYTDANGEEIVMNQGRTWVCIVLPGETGEITLE